ncbi:hypothetical protein SDC9_189550 [bioreactor metagenome]|uniref:Uncharacterized protein n=1 Tax=bioreactor metagenome TaxID=1076179 RepID=A0A645I0P1_9ZZZZ
MTMAAHSTAPCLCLWFFENSAFFDILQKITVAFFMFFFNLPHPFEQTGNIFKTFRFGGFSKFLIHAGPLIVLTLGCMLQIGLSITNTL